MRIVMILILIVAFAAIGAYFWPPAHAFFTRWESTQPEILDLQVPGGIGMQGAPAHVHWSDEGAGITSLAVVVVQGDRVHRIVNESFENPVREQQLSFTLPGRQAGLREGEAVLRLTATDNALWTNTSTHLEPLVVDYRPPIVEPISVQHNISQGGSGLVLFRTSGDDIRSRGIEIGADLFPAYPVRAWGSDFGEADDVFFSFFSVGFEVHDEPVIFAVDRAGNRTSSVINHRILTKERSEERLSLSEGFVMKVVKRLLGEGEIPTSGSSDVALLTEKFREVNEGMRARNEAEIVKITSDPLKQRLWDNVFARPLAGASTTAFGVHRTYKVEGQDAGESNHEGIDLASTAHAKVTAANTGKVIFAGDLGIYGNTVVLDHGFGLATLYGHLSAISCKAGEIVERGEPLGNSGQTGLAGGDHLHFEVRVHGRPVTPIEWWDKRWIQAHVEAKFRSVQLQDS